MHFPVKNRLQAESEVSDIGEWPINERRRSAVILLLKALRGAEEQLAFALAVNRQSTLPRPNYPYEVTCLGPNDGWPVIRPTED